MSEKIMVEYKYIQLHSWTESRDGRMYFMGRADVYDSRTHQLVKSGEPGCAGFVELNGWASPADRTTLEGK